MAAENVVDNATKSFFQNDMQLIHRSMEQWTDLGYSLDIPWNDVVNTGWMDAKPTHDTGAVWGEENVLVTSREPEYFAPDNIVRTTGTMPIINVNDPRYMFDRTKYSYKLF